jgi:hypothetical protein
MKLFVSALFDIQFPMRLVGNPDNEPVKVNSVSFGYKTCVFPKTKIFADWAQQLPSLYTRANLDLVKSEGASKSITDDAFYKAMTKHLGKDYDEFYFDADIDRIRKEFEMDKNLFVFKYRFNHFWHSTKQIAIGGQWESKMLRVVRWRNDFRHQQSFNYFTDKFGKAVDRPHYKVKAIEDRLVYHMGYASKRKEVVQAKINYYKNRGIEANVKDTWTNWKEGENTQPTAGGGTVTNFTGTYPEGMKPLLELGY